jgi:nucleoside 2-deoxyribosyltransferase
VKIYLASFFDTRERIRPYANKLWEMGHEITSTWLNEVARPEGMTTEEFWKKLAIKDLAEINAADLLILDTIDVTPRGGREVELGFALGRFQTKSIYMVGPVRNVFHTLVDRRFDSYDALLEALPNVTRDAENPTVASDNKGMSPKVKSKAIVKAA